jgi:hypothetical protein
MNLQYFKNSNEREERVLLALLAGKHTNIWLEREHLGMPQLQCSGKRCLALFNNVFEAQNLLSIILLYLCSRNSATWQWHSAPPKNMEFWLEFRHGWALVIFITSCKNTNA